MVFREALNGTDLNTYKDDYDIHLKDSEYIKRVRFVVYQLMKKGRIPPILKPLQQPSPDEPRRIRPLFASVHILPAGDTRLDGFGDGCHHPGECVEAFRPTPAEATYKNCASTPCHKAKCSIHVLYYISLPEP